MKKTFTTVLAFTTIAGNTVQADEVSNILNSIRIKPNIQTNAAQSGNIVAKVNGENVTQEQLDELFNSALKASGTKRSDLNKEQKLAGYNQLIQDLIMDKLVALASENEIVTDADVDAELAKMKNQFPDENAFQEQLRQSGMPLEKLKENTRTGLKQSRWMNSQVALTDVTEEQAKAFYDSNISEFKQPATVRASHILITIKAGAGASVVKQKKDAATKAWSRANAGEDFNALAKELSEEPGAAESGGDLGFFPKDRMVTEFAEAAFSLDVGEISKPVKTQFGWHVIKVTDKKEAGSVPFSEAKEQVITYLQGVNRKEAVQGVLDKLKNSANIEIFLPKS
jgi:peptidyl-prolyl cis-trans isomerase C